MNCRLRIVFLGPPGSGKGTQADLLAKRCGIPHISTGALFRNNPKLDPHLKKRMAEGYLLSDADVLAVLNQRIAEPDAKNGYILDGFPRNLKQASDLESIIGHEKLVTLLLVIDDAEVKARLTNRRTCENCGATYHLISAPPEVAGKCDECGSPLHQRSDDKPEVIENRLRVYHETTAPLVEFYTKRNCLIRIDAHERKSPMDVHEAISAALRTN